MALGTAFVLRLLRIRSTTPKHAAWTAVLAVMLLMPAWTAWGPKVSVQVLPATSDPLFEPEIFETVLSLPAPEADVNRPGFFGGSCV
jgi:hypothetical protein